MGLCDLCAGLTVEEIRGRMTFYHPNLRSLQDSADAGCDLCGLCWAALRLNNPSKTIDAVLAGKDPDADEMRPLYDERVWLTGCFFDDLRRRGVTGTRGKAGDLRVADSVWVDCGSKMDPESTISPPVLQAKLHVFADPGTPAASYFEGRYFTADRNPDEHFDFVRNLFSQCQSGHPECALADEEAAPEMPTRVLDVGSSLGSTRLVLSRNRGLREPYLALSYCWGPGVQHTTMLRNRNLSSLLESINEDALSATHRECIAVARQLGIRYIWIDSLCIIQGDPVDWEYESKRMAEVYGNAVLTIVAGRTADSRMGFLANTVKQAHPPLMLRYGRTDRDGQDLGNIFLCIPRSAEVGPLDIRGWCYQERVLSRRALSYGWEQVGFFCQRSGHLEDGCEVLDPSYQLRAQLFQSSEDAKSKTGGSTKTEQERLRTLMLQRWYKEVFLNYTSRKLTNPHDVFAAVASIAQPAQRSIRSRYLAGVWEVDLVRGLLWYTRFSISGEKHFLVSGDRRVKTIGARPRRPTDMDGKKVVRAPSWSWAAIEGQVCERSTPRNEAKYRDPANFLIRPLPSTLAKPTARWTLLENPNCDADILHQPYCELCFLGRPKHAQIFRSRTNIELPGLTDYDPWTRMRNTLWKEGYLVLLEPAASEYTEFNETGGVSADTAALTFAVACFDIAGETVDTTDCWFLPLLRPKFDGLLLRREPSDGKFRRLGLVGSVKEQFQPWLLSGSEEEVHLV
ncbi:HET-domain-containing protein [Hypoxylon sp. NC1633]|nr:HET-domain-containing protein [Hypoxylon sp. NC1633]